MSAQMQKAVSPVLTRAGSYAVFRSPAAIFFLGCMLAIGIGWKLVPLDRYLTPERGVGYALGIVGGSLMLLLLIYPARKRLRWLGFAGSVKAWFQIHMVMGVVGPILVLYHANFRLGATNSNVALICMLLVSGSGLIGRYFYTKIHEGLYGHETTLADLQAQAGRLRNVTVTAPLLSGLIERLAVEESRLLESVSRHFLLTRPIYAAAMSYGIRWRMQRYARSATRTLERRQRVRQLAMAREYIRTRIGATRRVSEYQAYVSLFSWWHILHLPLFFLLLIAGIVHVIAVHIY